MSENNKARLFLSCGALTCYVTALFIDWRAALIGILGAIFAIALSNIERNIENEAIKR